MILPAASRGASWLVSRVSSGAGMGTDDRAPLD
jgi:hypothetical protein